MRFILTLVYVVSATIHCPESRTLTLEKNLCYLLDWKPFKNDEKCFLFHLENFSFSRYLAMQEKRFD